MSEFREDSIKDIAAERFEKFRGEILSIRMLGFALSRVWVYVVFFNAEMVLDKTRANEAQDGIYIISLIALVALLIGCGFAHTAVKKLSQNIYGRTAPAILSILGTTAIPFVSLNETAGIAAGVFAGVMTGLGSGLFVVLWGRVYGRLGGSITVGDATVAYMLASLPVPLFVFMPLPAQLLVVTALPIGSTIALSHELDRVDQEDQEDQEENKDRSLEQTEQEPASQNDQDSCDRPSWSLEVINLSWKKVLGKLFVSSLVFGCVIAFMRSASVGHGVGTVDDTFNGFLPIVALIAGLIVLTILFFNRQLDLAYTYKPVLILMVIGCILLPFSMSDSAQGNPAHFVTMIGYICFEIMNWTILSDISFRFNLPACRVFGFGRASASGGVLFGALLGLYFNVNESLTTEAITALAFVFIFAVIIVYTFTLTERDVAKITRMRNRYPISTSADDTSGEDRPLTIEEKVEILAERFGIHGRGREVLLLLAQGNSATRIEQTLYMSKGTVNTHTRRLYQKLGVHKRQDLIDLVNKVDENESA